MHGQLIVGDKNELGILRGGLHVLVEKPISVHKADCEKLIAAKKNDKQKFAAMFNERTRPTYKKVKKLIEDGELGEILRVKKIFIKGIPKYTMNGY